MASKQRAIAVIRATNKYVAHMNHNEILKLYREWSAGIPSGLFKRFIKEGIEPFLKRYGYSMNISYSQLEKFCKEWAFAHVHIQRKCGEALQRTFLKTYNNGGEEEYDWYMFTIPTDDWLEFANEWSCPEFLDESDTGYAQRMDLPLFVWNIIDIEHSARHHKWLEFNKEEDEDDVAVIQPILNPEDRAFGGDRRTL